MRDTTQELFYAKEGLKQMHQPDAGYFEDINHKQPWEIDKYNCDVNAQVAAIDRLEKKLVRERGEK